MKKSRRLHHVIFLAGSIATACSASFAQGPTPDAPTSAVQPVSGVVLQQPSFETHKFLDGQNRILFVAVAALNGADFAVTHANLQNGGHELNPIVRPLASSTPALALNFAIETAGVVGVSYFFHKTGHHKFERLTSYVNIGASAGAVSYGLLHR
jgi:hypothetical protein